MDMEAIVRQIVSDYGTEVATRRLVRTTYKERNGLTALSKNEKTDIHFYLDKIVEELITCPVDTAISQMSPQPESFPVKLQRSDMNFPGSDSPGNVSKEGHRTESENQTDVSAAHADFSTSHNSLTVVENGPQVERHVGNKSDDDQGAFSSNRNRESESVLFCRGQQKMKSSHHHHAERERKGTLPQSSRNLFDSISQTRCFGRKVVENCNGSIITGSGKIQLNTVKSKNRFDCSVNLQKVDKFVKVDADSDSECDPTFKSFKIKRYLSAAAVRKAILDSDSECDRLTRKQIVIDSDSECVQSDMEVAVIESTSESDQLFIDLKPCKTAAITVGSCETTSDSESENENEDSVLAVREGKKMPSLQGRKMNNKSDDDSEDMCNPTKRRKLGNDEVQSEKTPLKHKNLSAADIRCAVLDSDSESHQSDDSSVSSFPGKLQTNSMLYDDTDNSPFFNKRKKKRMAAISDSELEEMDSGETDCNETLISIDEAEAKDLNSDDEAKSDEDWSVLQISETESNYENCERPETEINCEDLDTTLVNCEQKGSAAGRASEDSGISVEKNQSRSKILPQMFCPKYKSSSFERKDYHLHDSCTLSDPDIRRSHQSLSSRRMLESGSESDLSDICDSEKRSSDEESDVTLATLKKSLGTSDKDEKKSGKENRKKNGPIARNISNEYDTKHAKELQVLRKICRRVGVILRNTIELKGCDTTWAKVERIKNLLKEKGMKGRPSMKSAQQFMLEKELKDLGSAMNTGDHSRSSRSRSRTSCIENTTGMSPDRSLTELKEQTYAFSHMSDIFTIDDSSD